MRLRCIAVDDEPLALDIIEKYAREIPFLLLEGKFVNPFDAIDYLHSHPVDLIFLDIEMNQLSGLQFLEVINPSVPVVLVTAYDKYAIKGYEFDVADYLLKPYTFERFFKSVNKVYQQNNKSEQPSEKADAKTETRKFIFLKSGTKIEKINVDEIVYIEGMREYLQIHTINNRVLVLMSFAKLEELLPKHEFVRAHKSFMVSIPRINRISDNHIVIGDKHIPIGKYYKAELLRKIE